MIRPATMPHSILSAWRLIHGWVRPGWLALMVAGWILGSMGASKAAESPSAQPAPAAAEAPPKFVVSRYDVVGNTLLPANAVHAILTNFVGTNIGVAEIMKAGSALQLEYRTRGFATVNVTIPPQQITNETVKLAVFEGRLKEILVVNNRYFSSNNVMRALPSVHPDMILSSPVFQTELDQANGNQDRQIYPQIEPGPDENTTLLRLNVKDRLPLHGKMDFNNQSSPGTPDLRFNTSMAYNNLWQQEHSAGLQYSFSPTDYKAGSDWIFLDRPLVANYSGFYRMPLGSADPVASVVESNPGSFGYDEGTRRFRLPASTSGRPELNFFASRSTIDTGVTTLSSRTIQNIPGVLSIVETDLQQDLTVNNAVGFRLSTPLPAMGEIQSSLSFGLDWKGYELTSYKTNNFVFSITTVNPDGTVNPPIVSTVASPVPTSVKQVSYEPIAFRYDASRRDSLGLTAVGLGLSANLWFSGTTSNFQSVAGSREANGYWVAVTPSLTRDFIMRSNWIMTIRAEGQWASQPLISNEQFGIGGVASIRGYHEGEIFGDSGWRVSVEQKTRPFLLGYVDGTEATTLRGSIYMDYGQTYLRDPQGRKDGTPLWGVGIGLVAAAGSHWEARLMLSLPLVSTTTTEAGQSRLDFGFTAQF